MMLPPNRMKKSTANTLSYDEILSKLESVKQEQKEFEKGKRKALYQFLQQAAEAAVMIEANKNAKSQFHKKMADKNVLRAALVFIFDAKSETEKKEASKRARALRYLIEKLGIPTDGLAKAIQTHGGIEKLAKLSAKSSQEKEDDQGDKHRNEQGQEERVGADRTDAADRNFGRLVSVGLSPKQAKTLSGLAEKTRVKVIGYVRISSDDSRTIEVEKIVKVITKMKPHEETDADDWK